MKETKTFTVYADNDDLSDVWMGITISQKYKYEAQMEMTQSQVNEVLNRGCFKALQDRFAKEIGNILKTNK